MNSILALGQNAFSQPLPSNEQTEKENPNGPQNVNTMTQFQSKQNGNLFAEKEIVDLTGVEQHESKIKIQSEESRKRKSTESHYPQPLIQRTSRQSSEQGNLSSAPKRASSVESKSSSQEQNATKKKEVNERNSYQVLEKVPTAEEFLAIRELIEAGRVDLDETLALIDKLKNAEKIGRQSVPTIYTFTYACELKILEATLNLNAGEYEKALNSLDFSPADSSYYNGNLISPEHFIKSYLIRIRALNELSILNSIQPIKVHQEQYNQKLEEYYKIMGDVISDIPDLNLAIKIEKAKTLNIRGQHAEAFELLCSSRERYSGVNDPNILGRFQCELSWVLFGCEKIDEANTEITRVESLKPSKNILAWSGYLHSKFLFSMNHLSEASLILDNAFKLECPNKNIKYLLLILYKNIIDRQKLNSELEKDSKSEYGEGSDTDTDIDK